MKSKKYIYIIIFVAITALVIGAIIINNIKIPSPPNDNNHQTSDTPQGEEYELNISCKDITMYIDDEYSNLYITITSNEKYTVDYAYDSNALEIIDQKVYAKKTGSYTVTVIAKISSTNLEFSDSFVVTILDTITEVNSTIYKNNESVDNLFVGENYIIEFTFNANMNIPFTLIASDNVSNLESLIINDENKIRFSFNVISADETFFIFEYRNFSKKFIYDTYEYIDNFDINFENGYKNNILTLYIFNSDFTLEANNDDIFNQTKLNVNVDNNNLELFEIKILDNQVAYIENNSIIAKSVGETTLLVTALDGSNYSESITIKVENVLVDEISPAYSEKILNKNESLKIEYAFSPKYAITNFEITTNGEILTDNTFYAQNTGTYTILITDKIANIFANILITVNEDIPPSKVYYSIEFNQSILDEYNTEFKNDVLSITTNNLPIYISFSFILLDEYQGEITTDVSLSGINRYDFDKISNVVNLCIYEKGTLNITLTLLNNGNLTEICYTFKIVVL